MKFRPCIDLHAGVVKQIVGSTLRDTTSQENSGTDSTPDVSKCAHAEPVTNFTSTKSSAEFAAIYREDDIRGGHVIMLGANQENKEAALAALREFPGGLQVGGGINADNAQEYIDAGASHVIVTSYVFRNGIVDLERMDKLSKAIGKDKLVLDLSCRKKAGCGDDYYVVTDRWQKFSDVKISQETLTNLSQYCDEFLVHAVDVEGKRCGVLEDLVKVIGKWSPIPVTYAGGVRDLSDIDLVASAGAGKVDVSVGSALDLFGGDLAYHDVVAWHNRHQ